MGINSFQGVIYRSLRSLGSRRQTGENRQHSSKGRRGVLELRFFCSSAPTAIWMEVFGGGLSIHPLHFVNKIYLGEQKQDTHVIGWR